MAVQEELNLPLQKIRHHISLTAQKFVEELNFRTHLPKEGHEVVELGTIRSKVSKPSSRQGSQRHYRLRTPTSVG